MLAKHARPALLFAAALALAVPAVAAPDAGNGGNEGDNGGVRHLGPDEMTGGSVKKGRRLTKMHCARCHVIENYNPYGGTGNTPSFDRLVTWTDGLWRISTFFDRPPHPVFVRMEGVEPPDVQPTAHPFELTLEQLKHIVAYARLLKREIERAE